MTDYEVAIVGGGIGGAALGKVLAENGLKVLIVEREREFRDRVRGEYITPWGGAEAQKLGLYDALLETCGNQQPYWNALGSPVRDLRLTTPQQLPAITFYHPVMQEVLMDRAKRAGADVQRGATVRRLTPGKHPVITVEDGTQLCEFGARLVVCADGRSSEGRVWGGFASSRGEQRLMIAGALFEGISSPPDTTVVAYSTVRRQVALLTPQGSGRARGYLVYSPASIPRLQGEADAPRLIEESVSAGIPQEHYAGCRPGNLLASFDATPTWTEHPYCDGVALIGDAAGATDPTWGQGLSMALRDARVLGNYLLDSDDWDQAGSLYAQARDTYFRNQLTVENWIFNLMFEMGPEADERRARALPLIAMEPNRYPDHHFSGPDLPCDERVRRRLYGEE